MPNKHDQKGTSHKGGAYIADAEIHLLVKLQGTSDIDLDLGADVKLCLPSASSSRSARTKSEGTSGWMIAQLIP